MKRLMPYTAVALLFVGILVAPLTLFRPERYKKILTDQLTHAFGHPVLIGTVNGQYFPPSLSVKDLSVLKSGETRYIHIERVDLKLGWLALLGKKTVPSQLQVTGFQLTATRRAEGTWDFKEWLPTFASTPTHVSGLSSAILLKQGGIRFVDPFASTASELKATVAEGQLSLASIKLSGQLSGTAQPADFSLDTSGFWGGRDGTAEIRLTESGRSLTVRFQRQASETAWISESPEWRFDHLWGMTRFAFRLPASPDAPSGSSLLQNWKAQYTQTAGTSTYTAMASMEGGVLEAKGTWVTVKGRPVTQGMLAIQNIPLASLAPVLGDWGAGIDGNVTGLLSDFSMNLSSQAWQTARATLSFEATDGSYRFPASSLQFLRKAQSTRYFQKKFPDLTGKGLPILKARLVGKLDAGSLMVESAGIAAGAVTAGFSGRLALAQQSVDGVVLLRIQEPNRGLVKELPERYVYGEGAQQKIQPIYGRLQGAWSDWKLRSIPKSKVPKSAQRGVAAGISSVVSK